MKALIFSIQSLLLVALFLTISVSASRFNIPRLSPIRRKFLHKSHHQALAASDSKDFQTFYYNQTLDHFNYRPSSYATFQQKYVINFKYWGGSNISAPIFAYLGAEQPLGDDVTWLGFLTDNALQFKALLHRYYGESIPFGSMQEAFKNASTLGYFNSAQAIADYAEILVHVKKELHAQHSPVIVIGGSYGGMLAAWLRLKYPHVALGALASSAPVLYFDNIVAPENEYYSIVSRSFREESETCYQTIKKSWSEIDKIASKPEGLSILSNKFRTCSPLDDSSVLKYYLEWVYTGVAQYDFPPKYPHMTEMCGAIDEASSSGNDTLSSIFAGVVALGYGPLCFVNNLSNLDQNESETYDGWDWQTCSEIVMPVREIKNYTMFPPSSFDLESFINDCKGRYGVPPRPHWITTYYGGHDMKLVLHRFASNILFSNGLRDPYSAGGVLHNISDSVVAVYTRNGTHCLDLLRGNTGDPEWLVNQRKIEVRIIKGWIDKYHVYLEALKQV